MNELTAKLYTNKIRRLLKGCNNFNDIVFVLEENGWREVNGGSFKAVYRHPAFKSICVKVYYNKNDWKEDSYHLPKCLEPYYLKPLYNNRKYIIQEWANNKRIKGQSVNRIPDTIHFFNGDHCFWNHDVRDENIKVHNGRQVVIDFISDPTGCSESY